MFWESKFTFETSYIIEIIEFMCVIVYQINAIFNKN